MRKIGVVLVLAALAISAGRVAYEAPSLNAEGRSLSLETTAANTPPLMYAGIRG